MQDKEKSKLLIIYIIYIIVFLALIIVSITLFFGARDFGEKATTMGTIEMTGEVRAEMERTGKYSSSVKYFIPVQIRYEVNGRNYNIIETISDFNKDSLINESKIGNKIEIVYLIENPAEADLKENNDESFIGLFISIFVPSLFIIIYAIFSTEFKNTKNDIIKKKTAYSKSSLKQSANKNKKIIASVLFVLFIIFYLFKTYRQYKILDSVNNTNNATNSVLVFAFFIVIAILISRSAQKRNKKIISEEVGLKVIKIDFIDYERERVFFEDKEKSIFIYETDFGEEFHENEEYTIFLDENNVKQIEFECFGMKRQVIQILKKENTIFKKNEKQNDNI